MKALLKGKEKINNLPGTKPVQGDPKFLVWGEEDSMIMSLVWKSMIMPCFYPQQKKPRRK